MTKKEKIISGVALAVLAVAVVVLVVVLLMNRGSVKPKQRVYFNYFDTVSVVYCYAIESDGEFDEKCKAVSELLSEYHKLSDIYNDYGELNNLKKLNDSAGEGPIQIDEKLMDMLLYAKKMHELTDGRVNVAMGAVLKIWHEYRTEGLKSPSAAELPPMALLEDAAQHCDIDSLVLDTDAMTAQITDPKTSLDVGAIAKGYATERAAELLVALGADGYALDIGSNLRMIGENPSGDGWSIKIRNPSPSEQNRYADELTVDSGAVVTSGNYERFYTVGGVRYHHIINEKTLMPSEYFASVTVIHPDSGFADAMSTALFNCSYEDALAIIDKARSDGYGDIKAVFITSSGEKLYSR